MSTLNSNCSWKAKKIQKLDYNVMLGEKDMWN